MKKDDKKPEKPKKKPQKKAEQPSEATPAHVFRDRRLAKPKYDLDLNAKKYRTGLTISEWQELLKKDPNLLTPQQTRQLEKANEMALELAKRISAQYDFTAIAKMFNTLETLPIARITQDAQRFALATQKLQTSLIIPAQQLALIQQNLAITTGIINQSFISLINAANITRSLFASIQSVSDLIVKSLSVDLASLSTSFARFTPVETINLGDIEVIDRDGNVTIVSDTSRTKRIDNDYQLVSTAKLDLLFTELKATRSELSEVRRLVSGKLESGITKIAYADAKFQIESSELILKGFKVDVQRSSKQAKFCDFFFSSVENFTKKWDVSHLMELVFTQHIGIDGNEDSFNNIIKGYVKALNIKIAVATKGQITEFFILLNYEVYINPKYLTNL